MTVGSSVGLWGPEGRSTVFVGAQRTVNPEFHTLWACSSGVRGIETFSGEGKLTFISEGPWEDSTVTDLKALGLLTSAIQQEKEIEVIHIGKEQNCPYLKILTVLSYPWGGCSQPPSSFLKPQTVANFI